MQDVCFSERTQEVTHIWKDLSFVLVIFSHSWPPCQVLASLIFIEYKWTKWIVRSWSNMNYAKALVGSLGKQSLIENIQSQAETEIGRRLNSSEESLLFSILSEEQLSNKILKVALTLKKSLWFIFNVSVWIWYP